MLIIAIVYIGAAWLVFFKLKLLPWNWPWRIVTALLGLALLAVFVGLLNTLTPSGRTRSCWARRRSNAQCCGHGHVYPG